MAARKKARKTFVLITFFRDQIYIRVCISVHRLHSVPSLCGPPFTLQLAAKCFEKRWKPLKLHTKPQQRNKNTHIHTHTAANFFPGFFAMTSRHCSSQMAGLMSKCTEKPLCVINTGFTEVIIEHSRQGFCVHCMWTEPVYAQQIQISSEHFTSKQKYIHLAAGNDNIINKNVQ